MTATQVLSGYQADLDSVLALEDIEVRFPATQALMDRLELEDIPRIRQRQRERPTDLALSEEAVDATFVLGRLSVIRTRDIRTMADSNMSFADIAKLAGERQAVEADRGRTGFVPRLSRQRVHQIHRGAVRRA